ncbi:hypothetical protein [Couchioplanes azureus]|uniref:hypothetical protein n=1 Tax=Couchioplanes caeruleus TaxID=56438 RepID=UPI00166FADD3|nr:hypothetical protein [Couchioplanes caeruleus]GGQ73355.1 hypothetical protein GCM10010166_49240 [Couchioplanes caeruleus subsp. azureus]
MTFALGIYDLFACSIPGFLYISVFGYIANRVGWIAIDLEDVKDVPSLLLVLGVAIAAYLIGHVTWPLSRLVDHLSYRWWPAPDAAKIIVDRDPEVEKSGYLKHSRFLLQARTELTNREVASEISRMRAISLMLRNCTIPLFIASACAAVELATGGSRVFAGVSAALLLLAALGAAIQSRTMGQWSVLKTFELSYWSFTEGGPHAVPSPADPNGKARITGG